MELQVHSDPGSTMSPSCINCTYAVVRLRRLLMMGRQTARNMESYNSNNKVGTQCVSWFYAQGIYHDARSYNPKIMKAFLETIIYPSSMTSYQVLRYCVTFEVELCRSKKKYALQLVPTFLSNLFSYNLYICL
jgi:hypothetical protein